MKDEESGGENIVTTGIILAEKILIICSSLVNHSQNLTGSQIIALIIPIESIVGNDTMIDL